MREWMREHGKVVFDRVLMRFSTNGGGTVFQGNDIIAELIGGSHSGFNTAVREEPSQSDVLDLSTSQNKVEIGGGEPIQTSLPFDYNIASLGFEGINDLRPPGTLLKDLSIFTSFKDAVGRTAHLAEVGRELDGNVNDGRTGFAGLVDHGYGILQHAGGIHYRFYSFVKFTALAGEIVLELNKDNSRILWVHKLKIVMGLLQNLCLLFAKSILVLRSSRMPGSAVICRSLFRVSRRRSDRYRR
jgi:hypothetical protein